MPTPTDVVFFATPADLRAWFEAHHESADQLWVGYHRKGSGKPSVTWQQLVDQALCFGWIDSVRYSIGDDAFAQRVTPRRARSVWSAVNIKRFGELEAEGLVRPRGRAAFAARDAARSRTYAYENRLVRLDGPKEAVFRRHRSAWEFFESQAPWYRRTAAQWVMIAKREETRERRLSRLIEHSAKGERIPPWGAASPLPSRSRRSPSRAPRRAF